MKAKPLQLLRCSPRIAPMHTYNNPKKLTRAQLSEALDSVPLSHVLGKAVSKELTGKQKKFCMEVAKGGTKADAYRKAYNVKSKNTLQREPYQLTRDQRITNEIAAMQAAIKAQEYQTPAALRALVIQSLVGVITDPDSKPGQITAAAKVLGTVTEVAAFTERKEVRTITSSETARAQVLEQLRTLVQGSATDAVMIDRDADSLLAELAADPDLDETHRPPTPQILSDEPPVPKHTIPHERHSMSLNSAATPQENPYPDEPPIDE